MLSRLKTPLLLLLASTAGLTASIPAASAGDRWRYEFDKREARQLALIYEGRRDGSITSREGFRLSLGIHNVARKRKIFARDGFIDGYEANEIREAQDRLSTAIFESRNNGEYAHRGWRTSY